MSEKSGRVAVRRSSLQIHEEADSIRKVGASSRYVVTPARRFDEQQCYSVFAIQARPPAPAAEPLAMGLHVSKQASERERDGPLW
jgi:hypothetical protein